MTEPAWSRRRWLQGLGLALLSGCSARGCQRSQPPPSPQLDSSQLEIRELDFDASQGGPQKAVVLCPKWSSSSGHFPLLIALHGRGESNRGLSVGAWGWTHDYWLDRSLLRARRPPLSSADLLDISDGPHLARLNQALKEHPFEGLIIACPYTPDILSTDQLEAAEPFAAFVAEQLIPRLRSSYPIDPSPKAVGIDGVSLGGRMSLLTGMLRPSLFGAVGTLQAAVRSTELQAVTERLTKAFSGPSAPKLRLLTSHQDPFRPTLHKLSQTLQQAGLSVDYQDIPGPHDYDFNRGPGGYEMLLWHDRVLRGAAGL